MLSSTPTTGRSGANGGDGAERSSAPSPRAAGTPLLVNMHCQATVDTMSSLLTHQVCCMAQAACAPLSMPMPGVALYGATAMNCYMPEELHFFTRDVDLQVDMQDDGALRPACVAAWMCCVLRTLTRHPCRGSQHRAPVMNWCLLRVLPGGCPVFTVRAARSAEGPWQRVVDVTGVRSAGSVELVPWRATLSMQTAISRQWLRGNSQGEARSTAGWKALFSAVRTGVLRVPCDRGGVVDLHIPRGEAPANVLHTARNSVHRTVQSVRACVGGVLVHTSLCVVPLPELAAQLRDTLRAGSGLQPKDMLRNTQRWAVLHAAHVYNVMPDGGWATRKERLAAAATASARVLRDGAAPHVKGGTLDAQLEEVQRGGQGDTPRTPHDARARLRRAAEDLTQVEAHVEAARGGAAGDSEGDDEAYTDGVLHGVASALRFVRGVLADIMCTVDEYIH